MRVPNYLIFLREQNQKETNIILKYCNPPPPIIRHSRQIILSSIN